MNKKNWIYLSVILISAIFGIGIGMIFFPTKMYSQGPPVIVDKSQSLNGKATYTYEGYGRREDFEDDFDKYSVGDTLPVKKNLDSLVTAPVIEEIFPEGGEIIDSTGR